jgi:hypothetical protein
LEWVKEKIDSQIDSSDEDMREQKEKKQFREILQRVSPIYGIG